MGTKIFDPVTLTLKFDHPRKKNFNLGHSFLTRRGRAFIFHMCIPCGKPSNSNSMNFYLVTLTLQVDLLFKKKNRGLWLLTQRRYLLLLFTYGCRRRAMLSFWQLWLVIDFISQCSYCMYFSPISTSWYRRFGTWRIVRISELFHILRLVGCFKD